MRIRLGFDVKICVSRRFWSRVLGINGHFMIIDIVIN